jgi:23S rRNA G2445 N2-methylase RlmL
VTDYPFFALTVPGVEKIAADEIRSLNRKVKIGPQSSGFIAFDADVHPEDLLRLRCVEDVFATLAIVQPLHHDASGVLQVFRATQRSPIWEDAMEMYRLARPLKKRRMTYRVVSQLEGRHDYRRVDLKRAAEDAVVQQSQGSWAAVEENAALEVWVRADNERAAIGIRLSDNTMRHRTYKAAQLPASLKPTVAAAMIRLTFPQTEDVFLDPMCGSGTLLIERALAGRYQLILGGDADPNALDTAKGNIGPRYQPIEIKPMDVRHLPLETASVDKIASNLPFGRQIGKLNVLPVLYEAAFQEFARVVKPGGRAVLLVADEGEWKDLLQQPMGWTLKRQFRIRLLGQRPTLLALDRN